MNDVPEMVKRVAGAISAAQHLDDGLWMEYVGAAITAIDVMREPTLAMADAGRWPGEDDGPVACWRAMIDAALASPTKE